MRRLVPRSTRPSTPRISCMPLHSAARHPGLSFTTDREVDERPLCSEYSRRSGSRSGGGDPTTMYGCAHTDLRRRGRRCQLPPAARRDPRQSRAGGDVAHRVFVLHDGFDDEVRGRFEALVGPTVEVCWLDARATGYGGAILPDFLPEATLFLGSGCRICYPMTWTARLPRHRHRGARIAGRAVGHRHRRRGSPPRCADVETPGPLPAMSRSWRSLGLPPSMPYFNAGVMIMRIDRWRAGGHRRPCLDSVA